MKKQVTKEEFYEFINSYNNKLEIDVAGMFEPPLKSYNDFTDGKVWPESVVAFIKMYSESIIPADDEYFIVIPTMPV